MEAGALSAVNLPALQLTWCALSTVPGVAGCGVWGRRAGHLEGDCVAADVALTTLVATVTVARTGKRHAQGRTLWSLDVSVWLHILSLVWGARQ